MSVTAGMNKAVKAAIATVSVEFTDAVFDQATGRCVSRAEVAEVPFTAFAAQAKREHVPGRLVVRRIPDVHAAANQAAGQGTLFDVASAREWPSGAWCVGRTCEIMLMRVTSVLGGML